MSKLIDKSNLGYLGSDFQYKLVKCFIEEPDFFSEIYPIVEQNTFTEPLLKQFVGTLKDYYNSTSSVPSYETLLFALKSKARMDIELEECDELVKKLKNTSCEGEEFVRGEAVRFFRQQNMIRVVNELSQIIQEGNDDNYERCLHKMEDVIKTGNEDDLGFNPYDIIDEVMHPDSDIPIPTGISKIDELLNGGLYKGHLGLVLGPSGFGKTTLATAISSYASTYVNPLNSYKGWKILQICFEDDKKSIAKKHFSRITQIEAKDLTKEYEIEEARGILDTFDDKDLFKENLRVKKYKTGTKSVDDIRVFIRRLINDGYKPDGIILDYFECLKLVKKDKNDTKWDLQENTMRQLENMAEEFNVALWVMTQGNKESFSSKIVGMDQAGGSVTKVQIGHVILSIARSQEDIDNNIATIAMLKNRQGKSGPHFDGIKFNNGTSTVSCDDVVEYDNALVYEEAVADIKERIKNEMAESVRDKLRKEKEKTIEQPKSSYSKFVLVDERPEKKVKKNLDNSIFSKLSEPEEFNQDLAINESEWMAGV